MSRAPKNTLAGRAKKSGGSGFMTPMTIMALVLVGLFAFAALVVLSGYAGNWRDKDNGMAHAFSRSAIGYAGLSQLLEADDSEVIFDRANNAETADLYALKIITLSRPMAKSLDEDFDLSYPTLIVMPKWVTSPMYEHKGWRRKIGAPIGPFYELENYHKSLPETAGDIEFYRTSRGQSSHNLISQEATELPGIGDADIDTLQTFQGENLERLITANDEIVLARIPNTSVYILSDPDLLNTQGLAEQERAAFALNLLYGIADLEDVNYGSFIFDLTVHGFGTNDNIIKLLLRPPFLAATLCLLGAGLLIGWQAFARFGDPKTAEPAHALGKITLADNGARFIKIARRETRMAPGYVSLIRRRAARDLNLDGHSEADINHLLSRRSEALKLERGWHDVSSAVTSANDEGSLLQAARDLYNWKQEISHERR